MLTLKTARRTGHRVYQGDIEECRSCRYYRRCCRSKSGAARTITSDGKEPLRRAMNERMSQPESQAIYARRKTIVEPVFGQIKNSGFRDSGCGARRKWRGVLPGLRGAQPQENHFFGTAGRGVSGVREASGLGMKKGRIKGDEVTNQPLSALFESKMAQKPEFTALKAGIRWSSKPTTIAHERCHGRTSLNTEFSDSLLVRPDVSESQ